VAQRSGTEAVISSNDADVPLMSVHVWIWIWIGGRRALRSDYFQKGTQQGVVGGVMKKWAPFLMRKILWRLSTIHTVPPQTQQSS
jgi:hypothetical protein